MKRLENNISPHISYEEATKNRIATIRGIDNTPDLNTLERMKLVANKVFEPLREGLGVPLGISSFYRSPALNKALGGAKESSHVLGEAIDIDADMLGLVDNKQIFNYIKDNLKFDQLIWEFGSNAQPAWVHVSYRKKNNRNQILQASRVKDWKWSLVTKHKIIC
ncbi:MAG: D-Ala-D-Ala carboxypeptidase family metallohydrolase [Chitinophagaceae bacterium]